MKKYMKRYYMIVLLYKSYCFGVRIRLVLVEATVGSTGLADVVYDVTVEDGDLMCLLPLIFDTVVSLDGPGDELSPLDTANTVWDETELQDTIDKVGFCVIGLDSNNDDTLPNVSLVVMTTVFSACDLLIVVIEGLGIVLSIDMVTVAMLPVVEVILVAVDPRDLTNFCAVSMVTGCGTVVMLPTTDGVTFRDDPN